MKFKILIMIAAICFAIIPMVAFTVVTDTVIKSDGDKMFETEMAELGQAQVGNLQALMNMARSDINSIAAIPAVKDGGSDADDVLSRFYNAKESDAAIIGVMLADNSGKVIAGTDKDKGWAIESFADYAAYPDGDLFFSIKGSDTKSTNLIKDVAASMFIKKKLGDNTLFVVYSLDGESSVLKRFIFNGFYSDGKVAVIDAKGEWSNGNGLFDMTQTYNSIEDKLGGLSSNASSAVFHFEPAGEKDNVGVFAKADGDNSLVALTHCPARRAGYFSGKLSSSLIPIIIVISILSIIAAILVSKKTTAPLTQIQDALIKIIRGDHETRISTMTNNEYGQMSRAFNNIVDNIVIGEDRYKVISDMSDNIIFEWNFKTNDVTFSNNFNKKFSYRPPSDHFGDSFLMKAKLHPEDADRYRTDLDGLEKGKNFENNEYRIKNIYGDFIWILIRTATLNDTEGNPQKAVGVMVDIDRAKKSEAKLTEQASYDALTELYNRETIENQIDNEISLSEMRKSEMAVLFIDVDDFKHYNDNYSHATGDQVLKFLARTIREAVDGIGFVGRYGGDEFIAMIRNAEDNDPAAIAQSIIDNLAAGFDADVGDHLSVSVSIGIAVIRDDYNTRVEYLIGKADDAMYSVKKSGKSNYAFI